MNSRSKSLSNDLVISSVAINELAYEDSKHFVISCSVANKNSENISSLALIDSGASAHGFIDTKFAQNHNFDLIPLPRPRRLKVFDGTDSISGNITHLAKTVLKINDHSETILLFVTKLAHFDLVLGLPWLQYHSPTTNWSKLSLEFRNRKCQQHCRQFPVRVDAVPFNVISNRRNALCSSETEISVENCDINSFENFVAQDNISVMTITIEDIEQALKDKPRSDPSLKLPKIYHEFLSVFSIEEADKVPPHRPSHHRIILKPGAEPPWGPQYGMSRNELLVLKKYLKENLDKGFIRPSSSPASSPVLFVKKPGGGLRLCVDYRALNELTVKNRYPIPRIHETLTLLGKAKYFTKLDVISAFNRLRIADGDEYLTAFRTRFDLYEYLVMPFGLANAPSSFQNYINDTLKGYLDEFCTAYIDDILIFSNTLEQHHDHVKKVLTRLLEAGLQIDINKCDFHAQEVKFLGLIISIEGIKMDPTKLKAIENWPIPTCTKDIFRFIGFVNFYRRFIRNFGSIVMPLTDLMKKDLKFSWGPEQIKVFKLIKEEFRCNGVLQHFDWDKPARLETDASDRGTGGVLLQPDPSGSWKPVAFFSRKMSPAESNYEIYDKELLAIVQAFEEWRPELEGSLDPVEVITDHKALEYFMKSRLLSRRQARWSEFLSRFNFRICYRPGSLNTPADALSRPAGDPDPSLKSFLEQRVLKSYNLSPGMETSDLLANDLNIDPNLSSTENNQDSINSEIPNETTNLPIIDRIRKNILFDNSLAMVIKALESGDSLRIKNFTLAECTWSNGVLRYRNKIVVPQCDKDKSLPAEIIRSHHEPPTEGHQGAASTCAAVARNFFWHGLLHQVRRFVRNCHTCSRIKPSREVTQGLLRPLTIAAERWRHIAMDFAVDLPLSKDWSDVEFNSMFVVVDRMTKQVHISPCNDLSARNTAYMFYRDIFRLHGLPESIVSDRGSQFTSEFWKWLCRLLQIDHHLSTAYHPQTDGQTERMNGRIEQHLRAYINFTQNDWLRYLPSAEFALNNHDTHVTGVSPFFATYGLHPRSGSELSVTLTGPPVPTSIKFERFDAENLVNSMRKVEKFIIDNIQYHAAMYEEQANKSRVAARNFKVGDYVWLNYKDLRMLPPCRKLDYKNGGPFKIIRPIGKYAFELDLPSSVKIHPVFHVSLLSPTSSDPLPGQISGPPPPLETESDNPEYEIERIVGSHWKDGELNYIVRWKGYGPEDDWSIPASQTNNFEEMVKEFHEFNPDEPKSKDKYTSLEKRPSGRVQSRRSSRRLKRG